MESKWKLICKKKRLFLCLLLVSFVVLLTSFILIGTLGKEFYLTPLFLTFFIITFFITTPLFIILSIVFSIKKARFKKTQFENSSDFVATESTESPMKSNKGNLEYLDARWKSSCKNKNAVLTLLLISIAATIALFLLYAKTDTTNNELISFLSALIPFFVFPILIVLNIVFSVKKHLLKKALMQNYPNHIIKTPAEERADAERDKLAALTGIEREQELERLTSKNKALTSSFVAYGVVLIVLGFLLFIAKLFSAPISTYFGWAFILLGATGGIVFFAHLGALMDVQSKMRILDPHCFDHLTHLPKVTHESESSLDGAEDICLTPTPETHGAETENAPKIRKIDIIINEKFGGNKREAIEYIFKNYSGAELSEFILEMTKEELKIVTQILGLSNLPKEERLKEIINSNKSYGKKTILLSVVLLTVISIIVFVAKIIAGQIGETLTKWILPIAITLISLKLAENFVGFIRITIAKIRYKKLEDKSNEGNI